MIDLDYRLDIAASRHMAGPDGECPHCGRDAGRSEYAMTGRCTECRMHRAGKLYDRLTWHRRRVRRDRRTVRAGVIWRELAGRRTRGTVARERVTARQRVRGGR